MPKTNFSAKRGNAYAQCSLATYFEELGDYSSAAIWYRFAAQQGVAQAQHNLGVLLLNGYGVKKTM